MQKILQVGNSYAVTIPKDFIQEVGWKAGQKVNVIRDIELRTITVQSRNKPRQIGSLTPEFLSWLKKFNARYKDALKELAKK